MSEQAPNQERNEALPTPELHELSKAQTSPEELKAAKHNHAKAKHEAQKAVAELSRTEAQLNPIERLNAAEKAAQPTTPQHINRELKQITLRRELASIRRKLPAPQRVLSRVIHQPVVRAVSEGAGKTISRPSGILGGGLVALLGTSSYLYLAKHLGFQYNYGVFLALFAGGFIVGLGLELLVHLATASRRKANN